MYGLDKPLHVQYWNWLDAARPARFRPLVLAGRAAGAAEDRRAAAGHAAPQHRRDADHRRARDPDRRALGDAPVLEFDKVTTVFVFVGFATPDFWLALC